MDIKARSSAQRGKGEIQDSGRLEFNEILVGVWNKDGRIEDSAGHPTVLNKS